MLAHIKALIKQSAIYGVGNILIQGARFLLLPIYTQFLSTTDYGILSILGTYSSILGILFRLGMDGAATRLHFDYNEKDQRRLYGSVWFFITSVGLLITLGIDWQGEFIFNILFNDIDYLPYGRMATWIAFAGTASILPFVLLRVREQAFQYIIGTFFRFILSTGLIIYFVTYLRQQAVGSLRGQLIAELILFLPFTIFILRKSKLSLDRKKLKSAFGLGLPLVPHQISGWALTMSDRLVLNQFVTLSQLGIYALGYRFGMILDMILQSINMAWAPQFYRMASRDEKSPQTIARIFTYYLFLVLFIGVGISVSSQDILRIMAKPAYHEAYKIVEVVILGFIFHGMYFMVVNQLFFMKRTRNLPIYTMVSASINIILNILTVPTLGIVAAAWNTVIGYFILFVLVFRESNRVYPIAYETRRILLLFIAAMLTYLIANLFHINNPWYNIFARGLSLSCYPIFLLIAHFFSPQEKDLVLNWFKSGIHWIRKQ